VTILSWVVPHVVVCSVMVVGYPWVIVVSRYVVYWLVVPVVLTMTIVG
jgi:hypothetical protein